MVSIMRSGQASAPLLSTLIETEIIPRLVVAHAAPATPDFAHAEPTIDAATVAALASLALRPEAESLRSYVDTILARNVPVDAVLVDLLAPAARLLGEYWDNDRCDFIDVTMALWRLQEIVREIGDRAPGRCRVAEPYRALFAAMPGNQHSFGAIMIEELFRREGWITDRIAADSRDLPGRVANEWFDLVGLTISDDRHIAALPATIGALRNVARNPRIIVMVGGCVFSENPSLALAIGADGTARDAKSAVDVAMRLIRRRELEVPERG